jgi:general secretion pathway protein J
MISARSSLEQGFALVELLASLSVMALISLLLMSALANRREALARLDRNFAAEAGVAAARDRLADRIERVWPLTDYMITPKPGPDFDGRPTQLTFVAEPLAAEGPGPLRRYRLSIDVDGDLVLESRSEVALEAARWPERQVLLHNVESIDVAYFDRSARQPRPRAEWRGQPALPALVRVRLAFPQGDPRRWPDLVVHPKPNIDTDCDLDVDTSGCSGR